MTIIEALVRLRNDLKLWVANNLRVKMDKEAAVGLKVEGTEYTIGDATVTAGEGAEVFNDYRDVVFNDTPSSVGSNLNTGNIASGAYSHAEGMGTIASAARAHAEGAKTVASGMNSHAEGGSTIASGAYSHAEGHVTRASGHYSHTEGHGTEAAGSYSHAEGCGTIATAQAQHVQGQNNIEDSEHIYAHIVGNGTSSEACSNAHTLDWEGNAWFQGDVYVGSTSGTNKDEGSVKLATIDELNAALEGVGGGAVDSVNGKTGVVVLTLADLGIEIVDEIPAAGNAGKFYLVKA